MDKKLDNKTVASFQQGDHNAFRLVYKALRPQLKTFVINMVGLEDEAEDITTETFLTMFYRHQEFNDVGHMRAFLFVSARNRALNYLKTKKIHKLSQRELARLMNDETLLDHESIKAEMIEALYKAIENLPNECQKIFKMLIYKKLTPAEIADILNISVKTVYEQRSRAIEKLRIKLIKRYF